MKLLTLISALAFAFVANANEPATPPTPPAPPAAATEPAAPADGMMKKDKKHKKGHKKDHKKEETPATH